MNRFFSFAACLLVLLVSNYAWGQDTLPKFSVKNIGNQHIVIGWVNNFQQIWQISIQRSFDSLRNYKTILSVPDPTAAQNGFADTKAPSNHMYYRLFIVLGEGSYLFTPAQRPVLDTSSKMGLLTGAADKFKDTTAAKPVPVAKKPDYVPSFYVYTNKDGYVFINLPDAHEKKYHIKFFENDNTFLFEIKNIKESGLTLDKANFLHAGWFRFELYNDEKLVEKNKFFLAKDF